ncbi:MAG: glycosyltransferase family 4 protein [Planctomycetaceae bacterium]|jgi:glycosyltransferase involved in cell wall biosynthesis|nr:glycosyltransferase family 4 protein [Planctomycetaceae bacterium]
MKKKKLIFDIAIFTFSVDLSGVPRFTLEVLRHLRKRDNLEIVLICSLDNEAKAFLNLKQNLDVNLPFQTREKKELIFSESDEFIKQKLIIENKRPPLLGRIKDFILSCFPQSKILRKVIDFAIKIKRIIIFQKQLLLNKGKSQSTSQYFEELVMESDAYFSPFHTPIPELSIKPSIRKAIVVYDLIPFVHPELLVSNDLYLMLQKIANYSTPDLLIFTVSENSKRDIIHFCPKITSDQLMVIPAGASSHFHFCTDKTKINSVLKKYDIPTDCPYIASIAAQEDRKNFAAVVYAFDKLCQKYPDKFADLRLVVTGTQTCNQTVKMREAIDSLSDDCRRRFIYAGYVDKADLPFIYNGASCFCFMSIYEGFGLPVLEAMQCGVPVITSNTSSLPEVVGDAGIMLDPHDVEGLADAMYRVISDENLRKEMIAKGLEQAKKFSWDRCVDLIVEKINID